MTSVMPKPDNVAPIRHMQFDFDPSKAAKYCWFNNSWGSAFILTFSALIPAGEKLVIEAVRAFRDEIDDPELKAQVTSLIGQEATHSRVHSEFNNMYDMKGLPVDGLAEIADRIYVDFLIPKMPKKTLLAMACAIEHITAIMAEKEFGDEHKAYEFFDEVVADFMIWHLLEELEHKSIAFDLYQAVDGRYLHRVAAFFAIWGVSVPLGLYGVRQFLKTPGFNQGKKANSQGIGYFSGFFLTLSPKLLAYFGKDFHPENSNTKALLGTWRKKLFGKSGKLTPKVTKTIMPGTRNTSAKKIAAAV